MQRTRGLLGAALAWVGVIALAPAGWAQSETTVTETQASPAAESPATDAATDAAPAQMPADDSASIETLEE